MQKRGGQKPPTLSTASKPMARLRHHATADGDPYFGCAAAAAALNSVSVMARIKPPGPALNAALGTATSPLGVVSTTFGRRWS